ncbi:DUF1641 domain-containing protein [Marichromatium gracile]|uniref:Uncharacterized protein DUF1641 n=1 Tax=Marichromatium gracile TaxID=1048 RepID=A0A4R4AKQ7_MARGR|nr:MULTISPECIES: DUF1641 domain-containing protein [Marichromatium]MBO8085619.1 DUF1641 domain-containing protein [Marichromatium sp.]MBK1707650.1 hypothetical protein [Marichromatium gracile]MCF1182516.1 DUF1641 domain-containing protein [Marichromatium gracile]RNE91876.1 DUF1641 domain-containing protein [Marichromatium sp. AB31]RNE92573.1 DUF1641 domain-containing protein [Marichromatium sp. AB32]
MLTATKPQDAAAVLADPDTAAGLRDLAEHLAPLLQTRRLHNVVDLLSATSDFIDMADDQLTQKLAKAFEEVVWAGWSAGNALRSASATAADSEPPTLWQLSRQLNDPEVRRGLFFVIQLLGAVGRQVALEAEIPEDD